ncbi:hypothetical protein EVAR_29719_1 [Eumeta japonica]|uniref:Uncharacterized protein n=1 Tax=Eumeta variegata TaxID=151549 RepID=A0A4C1W0X2_EUMVA|nr:hypothetical protein EVAR_29719_1 [Eumeta japonica]
MNQEECNGDFGYRRVSPHPGLPLFTMRTLLSLTLLSRASQDDGWLATVSDAPLPLHFMGGASVAHAEPSLEEIDSEIEKILNIPANVLLPQDEVQLQQLSDAEYSTLKNEVDELRKRVERGALMDALLSAEDEELASVENVCEMAKQNMAEVDMMFNFFNDHESVKAVQNATQFLRANIPFLKQINNFEFDNAS